jgi:hypothetical protein
MNPHGGDPAGADDEVMIVHLPPQSRVEANVLVVWENFAVAAAFAARVDDFAVVCLARTPIAIRALEAEEIPLDVVLLCPYLGTAERALVLEAVGRRETPPAVVELADDTERPATCLLPDLRNRRAATTDPLNRVLDALTSSV